MFCPLVDKRKKEDLVFDIVLSILDKTFAAVPVETETTSLVPPTPRSPIRPADDRPVRRRPAPAASRATSSKASSAMEVDDKENAAENELTSAVAKLKFGEASASTSTRTSRRSARTNQ